MIELGGAPANGRVALIAVITARPLMHIIRGMARHTLRRRVLVAIAEMTRCTLQLRMLAAEREVRGAVIKLRVQPSDSAVTSSAIVAELALMRLILLVACHAHGACVAELLAGRMTGGASQRRMRIVQRKVGALMIKLRRHELHDVGIAALVFGVTALTLRRGYIGQASVKAIALLYVGGNVFVAIHTQRGLSDAIGAVVAVSTFALEFGVRIRHLARHEQGFEIGGQCSVT